MNLQVGVKIFLKNREGKYLLLKRSPEKYPEVSGFWDIPGGRIILGTTLLENLKREVKEETGLEITSLPRLIFAQDIFPKRGGHIVRLTYLADSSASEVIIDDNEHTEYRWLTQSEIKEAQDIDLYVKEIVSEDYLK